MRLKCPNSSNPQQPSEPQVVEAKQSYDPLTSQDSRIAYQAQKDWLDIQKQQALGVMRLSFKDEYLNLVARYRANQMLEGLTVYRDAYGYPVLAISDHENQKIVAKRLLGVRDYSTAVLYSKYLVKRTILAVSWINANGKRSYLYFDLQNDGNFFRTLKKHGLLLTVHGRTERRAADALLAFSVANADLQERAFKHGWWQSEAGEWKFAGADERVIEEDFNEQ